MAWSSDAHRLLLLDTPRSVFWRWSKRTWRLLPPERCSPGCQDTSSLDGEYVLIGASLLNRAPALGHAKAIRARPGFIRLVQQKADQSTAEHWRRRVFGRSWPFNKSIVTTDTLHPIRDCALVSARGSGAWMLASSKFYYGTGLLHCKCLVVGLRAHAICLVAAPFLQFPCFSSGTPLKRRCDNHEQSTRIPIPCRGPPRIRLSLSLVQLSYNYGSHLQWQRCCAGDTPVETAYSYRKQYATARERLPHY